MKKKKFLAVFMAATMVCSLVAGCGSKEEGKAETSGEEKKVLTMMTYVDPESGDKTQEEIYQIYEKFTEETGIDIELNVVPWDQTESKVVITNQAGAPSDIALISSQKLASLVNSGALMPLDEMIDKDWKREDFSQAVWNAGTYGGDGKVYCIPTSIHTRGLWYNTKYVKEPPKTWDEVIEIGKQVMEENENVYGFGFWGGKHYASGETAIAPFTWAGEGHLTNDDGSAAWANEAVADAIRFMSDCYNVHKITPETCMNVSDYNDITAQAAAGNIAMYIDGSYARHTLETSDNGEYFKFAPLPAKTEGGSSPHFSNGWSWAIPAKAKNPDLAWEFIKWFSQTDIQVEHSQVEGGLPVTIEAQNDPAFSEGLNKDFIDNLNANGKSMDPLVYYQEGLEQLSIASATYCLDPSSDLDALLKESQDAFNEKYYSK